MHKVNIFITIQPNDIFTFWLAYLSFVIFMDMRADLVVGSTWKPSHTAKIPTLLAFVSLSDLILTGLNLHADCLPLGKPNMTLLSFFVVVLSSVISVEKLGNLGLS